MIGLNDFGRQWDDAGGDVLAATREVGASGWYILGRQVESLEAQLAALWGARHAVGVASGLDALEIALRCAGCGPGDRVLTTPLSAFATTLAIVRTGAEPVFADIDAFGLIDLDACRRMLAAAHPRIGFLVPVHLYGHALDLDRLEALGRDFGCVIVEDCAQAIGARFGGRAAGSVGIAAAVSFYPTKNLGAMGDGGAIVTSSPAIDEQARCLRDYGQSGKYRHDEIGHNSRLDELQAAILTRAMLPRLEAWTARRRQVAAQYLREIRHPGVRCLGAPPGSESCWHLFPVAVAAERKAEFREHLAARGVASGEHYPIAIPDQKAMERLPRPVRGEWSRARALAAAQVSLPIHPYLSEAEVQTVIEAVNAWPTAALR